MRVVDDVDDGLGRLLWYVGLAAVGFVAGRTALRPVLTPIVEVLL